MTMTFDVAARALLSVAIGAFAAPALAGTYRMATEIVPG